MACNICGCRQGNFAHAHTQTQTLRNTPACMCPNSKSPGLLDSGSGSLFAQCATWLQKVLLLVDFPCIHTLPQCYWSAASAVLNAVQVIPEGAYERYVERVLDSSRYWVLKIVCGLIFAVLVDAVKAMKQDVSENVLQLGVQLAEFVACHNLLKFNLSHEFVKCSQVNGQRHAFIGFGFSDRGLVVTKVSFKITELQAFDGV